MNGLVRRLPKALALALLVGFGLRAGYSSYAILTGRSESFNDAYEIIAKNLLATGRYEGDPGKPTALREPGFPLLIAGVYAVVGAHPVAVTLTLSLLSALTALLLRETASRAFGPDAGDWTFLLALFYPYFVFYTGYFYRETLVVFLLAATFEALSRLEAAPSTERAGWAGGCIGLCAVSFSSLLPTCALLTLYAAWRFRSRAKDALLLCALAALPSGLWAARNYATFHRFIPGATVGGFNFYTYLIVPDEARGLPRENEIKYANDTWRRINDMGMLIEDDGRQQEAYFAAGKAWIKEHPGAYALRTVRQVVKLYRPVPYKRDYKHAYWLIFLASLFSDGWLLPLGFWGLWKARKGAEGRYWGLLVLSATGVYALLAAIVRYRLPLMTAFLPCAGAVLASWAPARRLLAAMKA